MNSNPESPTSNVGSHEDYCRQLEAYLCRKNDGHLIRIVGPAFEQVCGWSERGIPLTLAMRGIDRCFERYYRKGPRRRPVRIEFCEADVLDVFDEWKRLVGVADAAGASGGAGTGDAGRGSLPAHIDRVIARLTTLRGGADRSLDSVLDEVVRELDASLAAAMTVRGDARDAMIDRLQQLDAVLVDAVRHRTDDGMLQRLAADADEELKPFRARMPAEAYRASHRACVNRLLRELAGLPTIAYE